MDQLLVSVGETHSRSYVSRVDRDRRRMSCGVAVSRVECCDESSSEGEAGTLKTRIGLLEARYRLALLLVEMDETLQGDCRNQECSDNCYGVELISIDQQRNDRRVKRRIDKDERAKRSKKRPSRARTPNRLCPEVEDQVGRHLRN